MKPNPILRGYSKPTVSANIAQLMREGYPQVQATAIAYAAARSAHRRRFPGKAVPSWMIAVPKSPHGKAPRRKNPVPMSRKVQIRVGSKLYEDFSGHEAEEVGTMPKPEIPDVLVAIGEIDGIMYTTVRDGKSERYIHEFKKNSRPLFAVTPDGSQIHLLGGAYDFTECGIVDKIDR